MSNRLINEISPYLLQHAENPVDWHPWGPEAFAKARREDRPVFLSVGYSACHWCHVMERESFADDETATLMNRWFVAIKVDREERPDVDAIFMDAVQALTQRGIEYRFPRLCLKIMRTRLNADLKTHDLSPYS